MMQTEPKHLTDGQRVLLQHVARYRLTVPEAVRTLSPFRKRSVKDVTRILGNLQATGSLGSTRLFGDRLCFFLTANGFARIGVDTSSLEVDTSFSEESKIRLFAMLSFCCLGSDARQHLTASDMRIQFSALYRPGAPSAYYTQSNDHKSLLGFLRVDMSGHGRWDRVLAKAQEDARDHAFDPAWRQFVEAREFEITLATALPQKAERLCRALNASESLPSVPIRVVAIPELLYLIAPPPHR